MNQIASSTGRPSPGLASHVRRIAGAGGTLLATLALTLAVSGCGGGGSSDVVFDVGVLVNGQPLPGQVQPGRAITVSMGAGQYVELDASEPVVWDFAISNSPLFGNGTTVIYNGLAITQTAVSQSRVVIDTAVVGPLVLPIVITLTATSTIDAAQVATVFLRIG